MDPRTRRGFEMWYLVLAAASLALVILNIIKTNDDVKKGRLGLIIVTDALLMSAAIMLTIYNLESYFTRT